MQVEQRAVKQNLSHGLKNVVGELGMCFFAKCANPLCVSAVAHILLIKVVA